MSGAVIGAHRPLSAFRHWYEFVNNRYRAPDLGYRRRLIPFDFLFRSLTFLRNAILSDVSYMGWLRTKVGSVRVLSPSVGAVIHDHEGRLLLQEKSSGEAWSLPAGGIELGEGPQEAIVREVMEETGHAVRIHNILGVFGGKDFRYTYPSGDRVEYVVTLFRCKIIGGLGIPTDAETKSIRYFGRHEMPELALPYPKDDLFRAF